MKHFLSIESIDSEIIALLVARGMEIVKGKWGHYKPLKDKKVGIYFPKPSTRTRTAFTVGAIELGATPVVYQGTDLQLTTGESLEDTGRVLSCYLDAFVLRTNEGIQDMRAIASTASIPVINAMSNNEHPTQMIGDLITLREHFGRLEGLHVLYVGEGNNSATALALAMARVPSTTLTLVTPRGYGLDASILERARRLGQKVNTEIEEHHCRDQLPKAVDAVYATRWETMGVIHDGPNWRDHFRPFCVTQALMDEVSKPGETIFMHDLPAMRGSDVTDEVLDGPQSVAFRQAHHKLTGAMVVLDWCMS